MADVGHQATPSASLRAALRKWLDNALHGIIPLPFGYVWNGHWCGFGSKRSKDGEVWWVQLWHPTRRNLLASNRGWHVV